MAVAKPNASFTFTIKVTGDEPSDSDTNEQEFKFDLTPPPKPKKRRGRPPLKKVSGQDSSFTFPIEGGKPGRPKRRNRRLPLKLRQQIIKKEIIVPPEPAGAQWFTSAEDAYNAIQAFQVATYTKFIKHFTDRPNPAKRKIRWHDQTCTPYVITKSERLACHHGKDRNKAYNDKRLLKKYLENPNMKRRSFSKGTIKTNCESSIGIMEVLKFPEFVLPVMTEFRKKSMSKDLRTAIKRGDEMTTEYACRVIFPSEDSHSGHIIGEAAGLNTIDHRLVERIHELVSDGMYSIPELKRSLESFVKHELFKEHPQPSPNNRRFFPTKRDIRNHSYMAYAKRILSQIDQESMHLVVDDWKKLSQPNDNIIFRPHVTTTNDIGDQVVEQTLLFAHQFSWQRKLLQRYGQTVSLLDASGKYSGSEFVLPLFFLTVKSNIGYQLVGSFITQNKEAPDIEEALKVFQQWSTEWNPTFLMSARSQEEILKIERLFPDCRALLCEFQGVADAQGNIDMNDMSIVKVETFKFSAVEPFPRYKADKPDKRTLKRIDETLNKIRDVTMKIKTNTELQEVEVQLNRLLEKLPEVPEDTKKPDLGKRKAAITNGEEMDPKRLKTSAPVTLDFSNYSMPGGHQQEVHIHSHPFEDAGGPHQEVQIPAHQFGAGGQEESLQIQDPIEITPHVSIFETYNISLNETLLKNGPHNLSLLQLKSLEPTMSEDETALLVSHDASFKVGWLYDEIINSYMWSLSINHEHIIYASSTVAQIMERRGSLKRLWQNVSLENKHYIFIPWNPSGSHWVLLVVHLKRKCLLYLDPHQMVDLDANSNVQAAKHFVDFAVFAKFKFRLRFVESPVRSLQPDMASCGVYICMYAKWLASGDSLVQAPDSNGEENGAYRQNILDEIAGDCLKEILSNREVCKVCDDNAKADWIQCTRCQQWLHIECVGLTTEQAQMVKYFVCPLIIH